MPGGKAVTVDFIGYLTAGPLGAVIAAVGTFLPPYLIVVVAARPMRKASKNASVRAFIGGVTAAAAGAIAGAAFVLGRRAIVDVPTAVIALAVLGALLMRRKVPEPVLILASGLAGLAFKWALGA